MPHTILGLPTIKARTGGGAEVSRDRWTVSLQFTLLETVDLELMIVNPMGLLITLRARGSRAGDRMTTSPAPETPRPVTVPTLQDRAGPARGPRLERPRGRMDRAGRAAYRRFYPVAIRRVPQLWQ